MNTENQEEKKAKAVPSVAPKGSAGPGGAAANLSADELRRRASRHRRSEGAWSVVSFILHVIVGLLLVFCTPLREVITPLQQDKQTRRNPAEDLSADRIEQISETLRYARTQEVKRYIEVMQTVLHNMDFIKNQAENQLEEFREKASADSPDRVEKIFTKLEQEQQKIEEAQKTVASEAADLKAKSETITEATAEAGTSLSQQVERFSTKTVLSVIDSQANAQNLVDQVRAEASFAKLERTEQLAQELRDAQIEVARMQTAAQNNMSDAARKIAAIPSSTAWVEKQRNELKNYQNRKTWAEEKIEKAEKEREEAKVQQKEALEKAEAAKKQADEHREARKKVEKKVGEQIKLVQDLDKRRRKEKDIAPKLDAARKELNALRNESKQLEHKTNVENNKARDASRAADHQKRVIANRNGTIEQQKREIKRYDNIIGNVTTRVKEAEARLENLKKYQTEKRAEQARKELEDAAKAQEKLEVKIVELKETFKKEVAEKAKVEQETQQQQVAKTPFVDRPEVTKNTVAMDLEQAYEFARQLELQVTESYKAVKVTRTAVELRLSRNEAESLTDVAKPVRMDFPAILREPDARTKDRLDEQKVEQVNVVNEANSMKEATLAMLDEAMRLLNPDMAKDAAMQANQKTIMWLTEELLAEQMKASESQSQASSVEKLILLSNLNEQIQDAALEDSGERSKDLSELMKQAMMASSAQQSATAMPASETPPPPPPPELLPEELKNKEVVVQAPKVPFGENDALLPGNVLTLSGDATGEGIPAQWMYLNSWYVIGPFPNPNRINIQRKFPPESVVDLDATYVGKDGRQIGWVFEQARSSQRKKADRAVVVPKSAEEYGIWYAYAEVVVDRDCDLWIAIGSDDRSDFWVNGVKVWGSSNQLKQWNITEGYRKVHFRAGRNPVLARIENGWNALGWSVCVSTSEELPQ